MIKNRLFCSTFWKKGKHLSNSLCWYSESSNKKKICIVGSGPAGFYTAEHLLKKDRETEVDIFEKLPTPFGLIRYGVAPDHADIKKVTKSFTKIASNERCNFYGNINVGVDVKVSELLDSYHAVVLAFGASLDRSMGIPGENSRNVLSARRFVGWYTGHPDFINEQFDLDTDVAAVIGQGNVALDVSRILLKNLDELKSTEIAEHAYEALKKSKIRRVVMVGRRGPLQVAFTVKEFREMTNLKGCHMELKDEIASKLFPNLNELKLEKPYVRIAQLMEAMYKKQIEFANAPNSKCLELKFLRNPKEILPDSTGRVEKMVFTLNDIKDIFGKFEATDKEDILACGLVIPSVGYKSSTIDPFIPFDENKHIIPNKKGKVIGKEGLYCSGWVKTGPIGVILSTLNGSYETADLLLQDTRLTQKMSKTREDIFNNLSKRGVEFVTFDDWEKINKFELEKGEEMGKCREKVYKVEEMLELVRLNAK